MKGGLALHWLTGCSTAKEREDRKHLITGASPALDVLVALMERLRTETLSVRENDYNDSAWPYKQAHLNGKIEQLDQILTIVRSATDQNE